MNKIKSKMIRCLLWLLNTEWLNQSPCKYGYINGLEAISYQELVNEDKQQPGVTVRQVIDSIDRFNSCPIYENNIAVIEPDGSCREGNIWDIHQLRQGLTPHKEQETNDR